MKKLCLSFAFLAVAAMAAWAQEGGAAADQPNTADQGAQAAPAPAEQKPVYAFDLYKNALGFSTGTDILLVSAFNLHYQRWIGDFGVAVSFGAMQGGTLVNSSGADALLTLQYRLSQLMVDTEGNFVGCLYIYLNSGYCYRQGGTNSAAAQYVPVGAGIGAELAVFKHISFPFELGYEYQINGQYLGPAFTGAVRYRF